MNDLETLVQGAGLIGELTPRLSDRVVSYGELLSSFIISHYFSTIGISTGFKSGRELIVTDTTFGNAQVDFEPTNRVCEAYFSNTKDQVTVVPGFISKSKDGSNTTLGRGGSDYTAAIIAGAINAQELQIWTDVSGMYTANPKLVKQAKRIADISYEEAMELSHFGAKVLYPPTIQPVLSKHIPIRIKNTFAPDDVGTLISDKTIEDERTVRGISHIGDIALLSLEGPGMVGISGISKRFFETLSLLRVSVVLITQASSEHSICVGIAASDAITAEAAVNAAFEYEIATHKILPVIVEHELSIVALVGDQMKHHQGLSGKMFSTLGKNNVNIRAIAQGASERNISAVIQSHDVKKALNTLHEAFFEENIKQLNLFVMGVGNVGSRLLAQIKQQRGFLKEELQLHLRVIGIANSKKMIFKEDGLALETWQEALSTGLDSRKEDFMDHVLKLNYRNSIFIDNTASAEIAETYGDFLKNSIAVVTCNKIACSSDYQNYRHLKSLS